MPSASATVAELLSRRATTDPNEIAVVVDGVASLTYQEWERRSNALARGLVHRGGRHGDRVVLLFDSARSADFACAYAGVHKASMVPVLLPPPLLALETARVLEDCGASVLVCPPDMMPARQVRYFAATPSQLESRGTDDALPPPPPTGGGAEIVYQSSPLSRPRPTALSDPDIDASGLPPVVLVHTFAPGTLEARDALRLPLRHQGVRAVVLPHLDLERFLALAAGAKAGAVGLSAAMARVVGRTAPPGDGDLSCVRHVVLSGPVPPATAAGLSAVFPAASVIGRWKADPAGAMADRRSTARTADSRPPWAFSQEGLLWYELLAPTCMNLPPVVRRLAGPLDVGALEAALNEVVRRHEPLRTTFEVVDSHGVQVVAEPVPVELGVTDLSDRSPTDRDDEVARVVREAMTTPFDLVTGPMFRPRLLRLGRGEHLLVVALNHAFWDDWSESVFERNMSRLYAAFVAGEEPQLPDLPVSFGDFAGIQRRSLAGATGDAHLCYWRDALAGAPLLTQLPVADPDLPQGSPHPPGPPRSVDLGPQLSAQVRDLARDLHATPFMAMLAAFVVLVNRYTGQDDVLLASVVANRDRADLHALVGAFAKKVLLRIRVDDDPAFPELVARARDSVLGAVSHQALPYETLLQDALGHAATAHGLVPYIGLLFQGLAPPRGKVSLPGVETSRFDARRAGATRVHFASGSGEDKETTPWGGGLYNGTFVRLLVMESRDGLACQGWGAFHPPAVDRLLDDYRALLAEIVDAPCRPVSELGVAAGEPARGTMLISDDVARCLDLRGFRIDPGRLDAAIVACPGIEAAGVALHRARPGDERLIAYVVASGRALPELTEIRTRIWAQVPGYAWPAAIIPVATIPRLPGGRPDLGRLPAPPPVGAGSLPPSGFVAPRTPEEHLLAACWAEVLGVDEVGVTDSYWQSFSFLDAVALARQAGLRLRAGDIARNRTVETLAAALWARRIAEEASTG